MMLLAAAHGAMENKEKRRELWEEVLALSTWEISSMSINEASTARARGIFSTRPCADDVGQAIQWQGKQLQLSGLCSAAGHSLSPGTAIGKSCSVCELKCPRTAWSWNCPHCDVDVCPACMAVFGPLVLEEPRQEPLASGVAQ
eukprot:2213993-Amphidinium_carterae.1